MNGTTGLVRLIGACVALAIAAAAQGQTVLIDTFGAGNTFTGSGTVGGSATIVNAVRFTVPAGPDVIVARVDMALAITGAISSLQVGIFNDSGGLPVGMPIVSGVVPGPLTSALSFQSTPFTASTTLLAGHNYWVGPFMSGTGNVFWGSGLTPPIPPSASFNGTTWSAQTTPNPLSIRVTVNSVAAACCNARGTGGCVMLSATDCTAVGGVAGAIGSTCVTALCTVNVPGACCHGTTCLATTSLGCTLSAPAGRFLGAGVSCAPVPGGSNPCCPADFDNSGALGVQDIFSFLAAWFAGCP